MFVREGGCTLRRRQGIALKILERALDNVAYLKLKYMSILTPEPRLV
jgi:hypothetical protein